MSVFLQTVLLLVASNVFMTFAWYAHLKELNAKPWYIAALVSWGIALFEYLLQVPANRIGYTQLTLPQLKILQEVITLSVFVPFTIFYMRQSLRWDFLWAGLCLLGAVYFIFRNPTPPHPLTTLYPNPLSLDVAEIRIMQKVKLFKSIESELGSLEKEINEWISKNKVKVISITGNIAPQTGHTAIGTFSASDVLVVIMYEDGHG